MMKDLGGHRNTIDHTFGPRYDGKTLMIGDAPLTFDENASIRIKAIKYGPSEGLYELYLSGYLTTLCTTIVICSRIKIFYKRATRIM